MILAVGTAMTTSGLDVQQAASKAQQFIEQADLFEVFDAATPFIRDHLDDLRFMKGLNKMFECLHLRVLALLGVGKTLDGVDRDQIVLSALRQVVAAKPALVEKMLYTIRCSAIACAGSHQGGFLRKLPASVDAKKTAKRFYSNTILLVRAGIADSVRVFPQPAPQTNPGMEQLHHLTGSSYNAGFIAHIEAQVNQSPAMVFGILHTVGYHVYRLAYWAGFPLRLPKPPKGVPGAASPVEPSVVIELSDSEDETAAVTAGPSKGPVGDPRATTSSASSSVASTSAGQGSIGAKRGRAASTGKQRSLKRTRKEDD